MNNTHNPQSDSPDGVNQQSPDNMTIALAGNPNCGKTTLFNSLTGADQVVGNWSGVTVQRLEGHYSFDHRKVTVVDLPGVYSLAAGTIDETIARDYIHTSRPNVVINILDASNLERHLYLTAQLLELPTPVIVALNMMDVAKRRGVKIDIDHLQKHLGCPVIPMTASRGDGVKLLKETINTYLDGDKAATLRPARVRYDSEVEEALDIIEPQLENAAEKAGMQSRWLSLKLLERDSLAVELTADQTNQQASRLSREIEQHVGDDISMVIADGRYGFARGLARDVVRQTLLNRRRFSDVIDKIILNRVLCFPIFALVMYLMFSVTISISAPFVDLINSIGSAVLVDFVRSVLDMASAPGWLSLLLADGLGGGITTVATFIPPIAMIFMCLSILSDSGYMARAAFVMDRVLRPLGLPGKAFLPMLVGFGCNVPGIMATRVLEEDRDRILAILANPFMSCGARLPVYSFFAIAFFSAGGAGLMVFSLYAVGIVVGLLTTLLVGRTLLPGETSSFVMELPPYHRPTLRGVFHHTWNNLKGFLIRAGKVIIVVVIVLSMITGSPGGSEAPGETANGGSGEVADTDSGGFLHTIAVSLTPVFRPMGISDDNWPAVVALFSGVFAKEAVVGSLSALYEQMDEAAAGDNSLDADAGPEKGALSTMFISVGEAFRNLGADIAAMFTWTDGAAEPAQSSHVHGVMAARFGSKAAAVAYLVFVLLYIPCIAVVAATYQEIGAAWAVFSVIYQSLIAWTAATIVYQICSLTRTPWVSMAWLGVCGGILVCIYISMRIAGRRKSRIASGVNVAS